MPETPIGPMVLISLVARTEDFEPWKIRVKVIEWFEHLHPSANPIGPIEVVFLEQPNL